MSRAMSKSDPNRVQSKIDLPSVERIQRELSSAISIDEFLGKDAIFGRLFSMTLDLMLEAGQTAKPGYEEYEAGGRNAGNNRNGRDKKAR
jgi:hypothetical protein